MGQDSTPRADLAPLTVQQPPLRLYDTLLTGLKGDRALTRELLLDTSLERLRLSTLRQHYKELAHDAAEHNATFENYLLALLEHEAIQRDDNLLRLCLRSAGFPLVKTLDGYDFTALPSFNKQKVLAHGQAEFVRKHEKVGNRGKGMDSSGDCPGQSSVSQGAAGCGYASVGWTASWRNS